MIGICRGEDNGYTHEEIVFVFHDQLLEEEKASKYCPLCDTIKKFTEQLEGLSETIERLMAERKSHG